MASPSASRTFSVTHRRNLLLSNTHLPNTIRQASSPTLPSYWLYPEETTLTDKTQQLNKTKQNIVHARVCVCVYVQMHAHAVMCVCMCMCVVIISTYSFISFLKRLWKMIFVPFKILLEPIWSYSRSSKEYLKESSKIYFQSFHYLSFTHSVLSYCLLVNVPIIDYGLSSCSWSGQFSKSSVSLF